MRSENLRKGSLMNLVIIGTGYVGLVTGACFSQMGNHVTCVDLDQDKINKLKDGILPIYEPGLEEIVLEGINNKRLDFTTSLEGALKHAQVIFIAVGTPTTPSGSADLSAVEKVASQLGQLMSHPYYTIVDKSTVPVGTADKVTSIIQNELDSRGMQDIDFDVVSNPEFLKEGAAVNDFMRPDRVIIGTESERAQKIMKELYAPFTRNHERTIFMSARDAEMTKYTANSMLALKISFINEIANMCDLLNVDVEKVRNGIGSDNRIGYDFIYPGCGYGGSCFPKDVQALIHTANELNFDAKVLKAVEERNSLQKHYLFELATKQFGSDFSGLTFAVWGLAFKPGTDDMREASSVVFIKDAINAGAKIKAYDPIAMENAAYEFPRDWLENERLSFVNDQYEVLDQANALFLITEWRQFRNPDIKKIQASLASSIVFDGRNILEPTAVEQCGLQYIGIGRS